MIDYREMVGGLWDEMGKLQFDFMVAQGLKPHHKLLDIGCGCLRGGVHFIKYLDEGNYYGVDKNADLLKAGKIEARIAGLGHKLFHLELDGAFEFDKLETTFDFVIAQSLFTHLNLNEILLCLINVRKTIKDLSDNEGKFYATYFHVRNSDYEKTIEHVSDDGITIETRPAFARSMHYTPGMLQYIGWHAGLECILIGESWKHPRKQRMVMFHK